VTGTATRTSTPTITPTALPAHPPTVVVPAITLPGGVNAQANQVVVDPTTGAKGTIWVDVRGTNMVHAVDGVTNGVVASVPVGCSPYGMAILGRRLYVANHSSADNGCDPANASVSVIDMDARTEITRIAMPVGSEPTFVDTDPSTGRVFVAFHWSAGHRSETNQAAIIADATLSVLGYVPRDPMASDNDGWGLATDPDGRALYIGTRNGQTLSRYNLDNLAAGPNGRVSRSGHFFFVQVNKTTGDLYFVRTAGGERPANVMERLARGTLAVINNTVINGLDTFDGGGVAINRRNSNRLYVSGTDYMGPTDFVQVMAEGFYHLTTAPWRLGPAQGIQPDPLGIAVNENTFRIYVANRGNNTLTVIEDTQVPSP
jgi:DNA-binding beta-propeller fold protein YncE